MEKDPNSDTWWNDILGRGNSQCGGPEELEGCCARPVSSWTPLRPGAEEAGHAGLASCLQCFRSSSCPPITQGCKPTPAPRKALGRPGQVDRPGRPHPCPSQAL